MGFALKFAQKAWNSQLAAIRKKGIIGAEEQVEDMVGLFKRSQLVFLLGLLGRFLQKQYLLIVTERRILMVHIPSYLVHGSRYHQYVAINRPYRFNLPDNPKAEYHIGCKVALPEEFAAFVGRPHAFVVFGKEAQRVFDRAAQAGSGTQSVQPSPSSLRPDYVKAFRSVSDKPLDTADEFIRFVCTECGKQLKAKRQLQGKRIRCTNAKCGEVIRVPSGEPGATGDGGA